MARRGVPLCGLMTLALAAAVLQAPTAAAAGAELFGKPLRGLSPVPVAAVVAGPEKYAGKPIRVEGTNRGDAGGIVLKDGDARLAVTPDGFSIPKDIGEARVAAEGRVTKGEKGAVSLAATGVEIRR